MKVSPPLLLLFSTICSVVHAIIPESALLRRQNSDEEVIAHFSTIGACFSYIEGGNRDKSLAPCKIWCEKEKKGSGGYGCLAPSIPKEQLHPADLPKDEDGNPWIPGDCQCNFEIVEDIMDVVIEGLQKLDKVLCAIMLSTLQSVAEIGIDFIPGGQAVTAVRLAIQGAKTILENGMTADSFFGGWVGKACGVPDWNFDLMSVFNPLANAPDSMGASIGCLRKNKTACKKLDPKPDPSPPPKPAPKKEPIPDPKQTHNPTIDTTKIKTKSAVTSDIASVCKLDKRARDPALKEGKLGKDETRKECNKGVTTVHITKTTKVIGSYLTEVPMECPAKYPQACHHYRSVMSVYTDKPDMVRWTCQATPGTGQSRGQATSSWGATALASTAGQHWWPWANGFVPGGHELVMGKKVKIPGCDRDEWPPRNFWPGDKKAKEKGIVQRVRFIPAAENQGAGQIWRNFCNKNGAESTTGSRIGQKTFIQSEHIATVRKDKPLTHKGLDRTTTITTSVSVDTARAIFTLKEFPDLPEDNEWHGLKQNPCWPSAIAPEDPGWALLTDDEFYKKEQHPELAKYTARYKGYPDLEVLKGAVGANRKTPHSFDPLGDKQIKALPAGYQEFLPGAPKALALRPVRRNVATIRNATEASEDTTDNLIGNDASHDEIDAYSDEELDMWMDQYMELLKERQMEESSHTVPQETEVQPTPVGQGDATATPAIEGKLVNADQPKVTGTFV